MPYLFVREDQDYSDFASGKVLYSFPSHPAFPLRLASEIFQRCLAWRQRQGRVAPCVVYDPCCGSASLLSSLAYLHWHALERLVGSDIDAEALHLAERNMALLTLEGLNHRIAELQARAQQYEKPSYREAAESAQRLQNQLQAALKTHTLTTTLFRADATRESMLRQHLGEQSIDMVLSDLPYGQLSCWQFAEQAPARETKPLHALLTALLPFLSFHAVVALVTPKQQQVKHDAYQRLAHFEVGKRRIAFFTPADQETDTRLS